jgi:hypothetical protein
VVTQVPPKRSPDGAPEPGDTDWPAWLESQTVSPEGVDLALIREQLARTPGERLEALERVVNDLLELRGGRWPEVP